MNRLVILGWAESRRIFIDTCRYWLDSVAALVILQVIFLSLFFGVRVVGGAESAGTVDSLVVGFFVWSFGVATYGAVANDISKECQAGTLEQLFMTRSGPLTILGIRSVVHFFVNVLTSGFLLLSAMAITGRWLSFSPGQLLGVMVLSLPSLFGVGLAIGGLALVFKRVTGIVVLFNVLLIGIVSIPAPTFTWQGALPYSAGATMARLVAVNGGSVAEGELAFLAVVSIGYLALGVFLFRRLAVVARRGNLLEQY